MDTCTLLLLRLFLSYVSWLSFFFRFHTRAFKLKSSNVLKADISFKKSGIDVCNAKTGNSKEVELKIIPRVIFDAYRCNTNQKVEQCSRQCNRDRYNIFAPFFFQSSNFLIPSLNKTFKSKKIVSIEYGPTMASN